MTITTDSVVAASESQVSANLQGETVILGLEKAMYYNTDDVGSLVWEMLASPTRVSMIRDAILAEFDVDPEICERDLLDFLGQLEAENLLRVLRD